MIATAMHVGTSSPGELLSETNDNSLAILLTYATAGLLLAGNAETRSGYTVSCSYARP
jgi:hypothetical protein